MIWGGLLGASYFLGAVPFGYLIAWIFYHVDIREHGSGNTGATNVWRTFGSRPGALTLALDILKGAVPVLAAKEMLAGDDLAAITCGLAAIIGHNWSLFLKGKGGKGVATSAGVFLALIPRQTGIAAAVFGLFFLATGTVSVGSIAAAAALLAASFIFETSALLRGLVVLASIMVLLKHIPNMKRLARGEEPKVKFR